MPFLALRVTISTIRARSIVQRVLFRSLAFAFAIALVVVITIEAAIFDEPGKSPVARLDRVTALALLAGAGRAGEMTVDPPLTSDDAPAADVSR